MRNPKLFAAGLLIVMGLGLAVWGDPSIEERMSQRSEELDQELASREKHIDPGELLELLYNTSVDKRLFDVRDEAEYNLFHILDAERVDLQSIDDDFASTIRKKQVVILVSNGEERAELAYRRFRVAGLTAVYILEGGINHWLAIFDKGIQDAKPQRDDTRQYAFPGVLGHRAPASRPPVELAASRNFTKKVKGASAVKVSGGCGG
ncbi:MAG: rhodanese-like domain-containing protein [Myxococcota bacterium]|jgi:rhodanese-related sulfurtransferase|nr:rhodanese-like domain-containing protein [Myxococcota bacterium]